MRIKIKHILLFIVLWWGLVSPVLVLGFFTSFFLAVPNLLLYSLPLLLALGLTLAPHYIEKLPNSTRKTVLSSYIIFIMLILGSINVSRG